MAIREVLVSFTFEQQRQMINFIGVDVGDVSTLLTPTNEVVSGINEIVNGDVDLINQTHGMDPGTLSSPSLYWDAGQGFYKVDANKIGLSTGLAVTGNLEVDGNITFRAGNATPGTLTFGDLDTDNVVFNADINSSIIPDTTASWNLGSAAQQWNNIWIDGTASIDTLTVDENSTFTGYLQVDSGDIRVPNTQTTVDLFDDYATVVEAFGDATTITIGQQSLGTITLRNRNICSYSPNLDLFNTNSTTVNFLGAAETINMGLAGNVGLNTNLNILSDDVVLSGDLAINGGELLSSQNTIDLFITQGDVRIGALAGSGTTTIQNTLKVQTDIDISNSATDFKIKDNESSALTIKEGANDYVKFTTTNAGEKILIYKDVYVIGNLDITGTTTTIGTTNLQIDDKNIELGVTSVPSDITADGGGITLKGTTDKTIAYNNTSGLWETNIGLKVTGNIESTSTVRVDHSNNAGSDILARFGNANNSGTNSAHLLLANGYYASPTDVDGTGAAAKILADGTALFTGAVTLGSTAPTGEGTILYNTATTVRRDDGSTVYEVFRNGTTVGDRTIILNSDGNATFGGTVTSNGITQYTLPTIGNGGQLGYDDSTKSLRLYANSSTNADAKIQFHFNQSATASMTFDQSGAMEFPGQAVSSTGNIVTKTSSSFSHYEEGTFRPYYSTAITSPDYTSPGFNFGNYIRIGNVLHYWITISAATGTNTTDPVIIYGLPYAPAGTEGGNSSFSYNSGFFTTGYTMPNIYIGGGGGTVGMIKFYETGSGTSVKGDWYGGLSGAQLYIGGSYRV